MNPRKKTKETLLKHWVKDAKHIKYIVASVLLFAVGGAIYLIFEDDTRREYTYYEDSNKKKKTMRVYREDNTMREVVGYDRDENEMYLIEYYPDGVTRKSESTYYKNGMPKSSISYRPTGEKKVGTPKCTSANSKLEVCTMARHGCDDSHYSCLDNTLYGGGMTNCKAGDYDINSDSKPNFSITCYENEKRKSYIKYYSNGKKDHEYTYYKSNGKLKTHISYQGDGVTKAFEYEYYNNGKRKTRISYQADGVTKGGEETFYVDWSSGKKTWIEYSSNGEVSGGFPKCYQADRKEETCVMAKHGCVRTSVTCIR